VEPWKRGFPIIRNMTGEKALDLIADIGGD
jgi:hypothetical protein